MLAKKRLHWQKYSLVILLLIMAALAGLALQIITQLPDTEVLNSYLPSESTMLFSADGKVLARFHQEENRQVVPLSRISTYVQKAVIATEDPNFFHHHGLDFYGIVRAGIKNFAYGRIVEGGSTITQQLARNLFLNKRKTYTRKLAEALIALQIERRYTKEEILELYLNQVYLGHNAYGIESAANLYFGKSAADLDLAESAMIAGLIRGPELYSPYRNFKGAKLRQIFVINKMLEHGLISEREGKLAAIASLDFSPKNLKSLGETAPYFISYVLQELTDKYGEEMVYHGGLKVYTSLDTRLQAAAEKVVTQFLSSEGKTYHFSQAALVSLDPRTGYIKALVGGADFLESKYNRVTQAKRPPGSSFKPFVYTAAIEQGLMPGEVLQDTPTTFTVWPNRWNPGGTWTPNNFDNKFHGAVTMRGALERSLNIPSIKLLERVGIQSAIDVAQKMGIRSKLEPGLALALGASEVSILELTSAFGVFANAGIRVEPTAITKIENRDGVALFNHRTVERRVLDENVAAIMIDLMRGVLSRGTGFRGQIDRPAAAKTGTSQEFRDAWFVGFVPQLATGVWVGNDDNSPMKGIAEVAICPRIWKSYNQIVLAGQPVLNFPAPEGLTPADYLLAPPAAPEPEPAPTEELTQEEIVPEEPLE
ncbi:MAG: PBP1A family penicillin-binding protein [Candidatus Margulisbacteria bacterium]|jgi:penicillin-binding protein 1A|nr:PBP1A family penicillin-binding protein [Candidatus Margulisiibacteriota bacterium]